MYRFTYTSTVADLLNAEDADMTSRTVRPWMRWAISAIGCLMLVSGVDRLGSPADTLEALPPLLAGSLLLYYFLIRGCMRRHHIRKANTSAVELLLEFHNDHLRIDAHGVGEFRREWCELDEFTVATRGILLYFDDGTINWLPDRVFEGRSNRLAFIRFLQTRLAERAES